MLKEDISIIVVDDLHFSREVFKSGLKKAGYTDIRTASSGEDALFLLNERRADVVLADFWMPNMNGLELTDLIRIWDQKNDRYTGIVLITAEDTTSSLVVAFDRGVDDFVSKEANHYEIAARVYGAARSSMQQNNIRKESQQLKSQFQFLKNSSLIDRESGLANKTYLIKQLDSMVQQCATRGGGLGLGIIKLTDTNNNAIKLRKGTLRTIANSIKLVTRPLDTICRLDHSGFAIALHLEQYNKFNPDMFGRLLENIKNRTREMDDTGKSLNFLSHLHLTSDLTDIPSAESIIDTAVSGLS